MPGWPNSPPGERLVSGTPAAGSPSPGDSQHQQHRDLGAEQHPEHPAVQVDPQHPEDRHEQPRPERVHPPGEVEADLVGQVAGEGRPEHAVEADLQQVVGDGRDQGGANAGGSPKPTRDVGVQGSGVGDVPGHGHIADGEDGQHQGHGDEGGADRRQPGDGVHGGHHASHHGHGRHRREDEVQDRRDPEAVLGEGGGPAGGGGRGGRGHRGLRSAAGRRSGGGPGHLGRSRTGLRSKKPTGRRVKPQLATGITGQSSGRGKWVIPKVCQRTMSRPSMSRSAAT